MAAAVSHGQGVVFGQQPEGGAAFSLLVYGPEGGGQAGDSAFHGKSMAFQKVFQQGAGLVFFAAEFGIVKNLVGHLF